VAPGSPARQVGDALRTHFAADAATTTDIVTSVPLDVDQAQAYSRSLSELRGVGLVTGPAGVWLDGKPVPLSPVAQASLGRYQSAQATWISALTPDPLTRAGQSLVRTIRALPVPGHATSDVGGPAASLVDQKHDLSGRLPLAMTLIALTTLLVLWLFTGSVILPVKALVLNALTIG